MFSNPNPFAQSQQQQQQQQSSAPSLFGNTTQASQPQSTSPFGGANQTTQPQSNSLFANSLQNNQPQKPSLFTNPGTQSQGGSLFGGTLGQPQQQQQQQQQQPPPLGGATLGGSTFGGSTFGAPTLNNQLQPLQQSQARPLWQPELYQPREKTIPDQILTLRKKWYLESPDCSFQKYFYNYVGADNAVYYAPGPGEDETKWEEALAKKPSSDVVPSLYRGFKQLAQRLQGQVKAVNVLNARLHEINGSLTAQQQQHELDVSVRAAEAKRRHTALSQRCLRLATKVQVLRNRGYVMEPAEEDLRKKLSHLEQSAFDPRLNSRREEIWARMVGIRERTKMLQAETERAGENLAEKQENGIDEEVLTRTKKV